MPEQVISPPKFFSRLAELGLTVTLPAVDDSSRSASGHSRAVLSGGQNGDHQ
jgi:hypothetical protein